MIKLIVSDMDGTLLNEELHISPQNLDAIKRVREKGIRFCIATGRPEQLVKEYVDILEMTDPMILYNGSVIGHPFQEKNIYELRLADDDIIDIIRYCEDQGIIYMPYTKHKIISKPNYRVAFFEERNKALSVKDRAIFEDIRDMDDIISHHIHKILLIENDPIKYKQVKEHFENMNKFTIATSQKGFIDINPKGASKGKALAVLATHFGVSLDEVVVFGDQDNDVSMLKLAGTSVVMANASKKAKEVADYITLSNNDSGFAAWINEHIID